MVLWSAVVGNHDLGRYALSFRTQHGTVVQPTTERSPYGETVLLFPGNVSLHKSTVDKLIDLINI